MPSAVSPFLFCDTTPQNRGNVGTDGSGNYFPVVFPLGTTAGSTIVVFAGKSPVNLSDLTGSCSDPTNGDYGSPVESQPLISSGNNSSKAWVLQNAAAIAPGDYGRSTSSSATTLGDSTKTWTANQWAGKTLIDLATNLTYTILSNTSTVLTFASGTAPTAGDFYVVGEFVRIAVSGAQDNNDYAYGAGVEITAAVLSGGVAHSSHLDTAASAGTDNITSGAVACGSQPGTMIAVSLNAFGASTPFVPLIGTGFTDLGAFYTDDNGQTTLRVESKYFASAPGTVAATFSAQGNDQFGTLMVFVQDLPPGPTINAQPEAGYGAPGGTASFTVSATATAGSLSYQWKLNGSNVGTNSATYTTATLSDSNDGGIVTCAVTDSNGTVTTRAVHLWITDVGAADGFKIRSAWLERSAQLGNPSAVVKGYALLRDAIDYDLSGSARKQEFLDWTGFTDASAVGTISGSAAITFAQTAAIKGVTKLSASAAVAFAQTAALKGRTSMAASSAIVFGESAALLGRGLMAAAAPITFSAAAAVVAKGRMSGTAATTFSESAALVGVGKMSGTAAITFAAAAAFASKMSGTAAVVFGESAALTGVGALAGSAALTVGTAAALVGKGSLSATAAIVFAASASTSAKIRGSASISFGQSASLRGRTSLGGDAAIAFAASAAAVGSAKVSGSAALTLAATATAAGAGAIVGSAALVVSQSAALTARGAVSGSAAAAVAATGALVGRGRMKASAALVFSATAAFDGASGIGGTAAIVVGQSATLTARGELRASAAIAFAQSAHVRGVGKISGATAIVFSQSGELTLKVQISGSAAIAFDTLAAIGARAAIRGTAALAFAQTARARGTGSIRGTAAIRFAATANEGHVAHIGGSAQLTFDAAGNLVGRGRLEGVGTVSLAATAHLIGVGHMHGEAAILFGAHAQLSGAVFATPPRRVLAVDDDSRSLRAHADGRAGRVHDAGRLTAVHDGRRPQRVHADRRGGDAKP